jgi:hypothetical protein
MVALTKPEFTGWPMDGNLVIPVHAYSVFGTYTDSQNKNYVVLRNPLENLVANTKITMITSGIAWPFRDICYGRNAQQLQDNGPKTESFSLSRGLFALSTDEVKKYIDWFGYVY